MGVYIGPYRVTYKVIKGYIGLSIGLSRAQILIVVRKHMCYAFLNNL